MIEEPEKLDLKSVKKAIQKTILECSIRGLKQSTTWLAEINYGLKHIELEPNELAFIDGDIYGEDYDTYFLAKSVFNVNEYERCAWYLKTCTTPVCRFLRWYASFLSMEKKKVEDSANERVDSLYKIKMNELLSELKEEYTSKKVDCYMVYLYGVILKKLELTDAAIRVFVEALHMEPLLWQAWLDLAQLVPDRATLRSLRLPNHWACKFFIAHIFMDLQLHEEALEIYFSLQSLGFQHSTYLQARIAVTYQNMRELAPALVSFGDLLKMDPNRLENMVTYSNLLYVAEMSRELAYLAHHACDIDKFRVETCCIVGNYYSMRGEHNRAVLNFKRALRLNPQYLLAWTLLGHEYMELKDSNSAIRSYRKALEFNRRDYRAWYGLGQAYEILTMTNQALNYYKQAQHYRPNDSRMLLALGDVYLKLGITQAALKCFYKAHCVGDMEGLAAIRLAKMYEKHGMVDKAIELYSEFVVENQHVITYDIKCDLAHAYKYLAKQHMMKYNFDLAQEYSLKCLTFEYVKEDGKCFLRSIALKLGQQEQKPTKKATEQVTANLKSCEPLENTLMPKIDIGRLRSLAFSSEDM